ncbi:10254_t:CDS:2 [Ambispora gerdemannii]|uniref:10254_t:CDS:1 n=1 Tax=Ambispora gerdemannii TaxID=144530 RepID=A0A9N9BJA0_9GLOM|nr:10254_t:CDS:2 [Ambispora gerdemannii]
MQHIKQNAALAAIARYNSRQLLTNSIGAKTSVLNSANGGLSTANRGGTTVAGKLHSSRYAQQLGWKKSNIYQDLANKRFNSTLAYDNSSVLSEVPPVDMMHLEYGIDWLQRIRKGVEQNNLQSILYAYKQLIKTGEPISLQTYNLILNANQNLRTEGTPINRAWEIYNHMLENNVEPDTQTYSIMMNMLVKRGLEVQKTYDFLEAKLKREDGQELETLENIQELNEEKNFEAAIDIFKISILKPDIKYDANLCTTLIRAVGPFGKAEDALIVYEYMIREGMPLTSWTFSSVIIAYGRIGDLQSSRQCLKQYEAMYSELPIQDKNDVYHSLINACVQCDDIQGAIEVIEKTIPEAGLVSDMRTYGMFIRNILKKGNLAIAEEWLHKMESEIVRPKPNRHIYEMFLIEYANSGNYPEATRIYNKMLMRGIYPRYTESSAYLKAAIKHDPENIPTLLNTMYENQQIPDSILTQHLVKYYCDLSKCGDAIAILERFFRITKEERKLRLPAIIRLKPTILSLFDHPGLEFRDWEKLLQIWTYHADFRPEVDTRLIETYENMVAEKGIENLELSPGTLPLLFSLYLALYNRDIVTYSNIEEFQRRIYGIHNHGKYYGQKPSKDLVQNVYTRFNVVDSALAEKWRRNAAGQDRKPTELETHKSLDLLSNCNHTKKIDPDAVVAQAKQLVADNILITPEPMSIIVQNLGKGKYINQAKEVYEIALDISKKWEKTLGEKAELWVHNSMLIAYASVGKIDKALEIYYKILEKGKAPSSDAYASLLVAETDVYFDEAQVAIQMYDEIKRYGVKCNVYFYNVLISKLGKARKYELVWDIYQEMKQRNIQPNAITYGALITACIRVSSEEKAVALMKEWEGSLYFQPRIGPYNAMMQFYIWDMLNREKALDYFNSILQHNLKPSDHTWKLLIDAYVLVEPYDMEAAHGVFDKMRLRGSQPNATHFASLIYAYGCKQGDVERAIEIFDSMSKQVMPNEIAYQALFESLIDAQRIQEAEDYYTRMIEKDNVKTTSYIENLFIRGYGQLGQWENAEQVFENMVDASSKEKGQVLREPSTYEEMVKAYVKSGQVEKARTVAASMEAKDFPPIVKRSVADLLR